MNNVKLKFDIVFKGMILFFALMAFYFYIIGGWPITLGMTVIFIIISLLYLGTLNTDLLYKYLKRKKII
jgi:hypothetical protein